jgi:hypothetical protein
VRKQRETKQKKKQLTNSVGIFETTTFVKSKVLNVGNNSVGLISSHCDFHVQFLVANVILFEMMKKQKRKRFGFLSPQENSNACKSTFCPAFQLLVFFQVCKERILMASDFETVNFKILWCSCERVVWVLEKIVECIFDEAARTQSQQLSVHMSKKEEKKKHRKKKSTSFKCEANSMCVVLFARTVFQSLDSTALKDSFGPSQPPTERIPIKISQYSSSSGVTATSSFRIACWEVKREKKKEKKRTGVVLYRESFLCFHRI